MKLIRIYIYKVPHAESGTDCVDFVSNGFKIKSTSTGINGNGEILYLHSFRTTTNFKFGRMRDG